MSEARQAAALAEARTLRSEAWAQVRADIAYLQGGLTAKPISERIKDSATDQLVDALDTARGVAEDNKAVVGLTLAALIGWLFRRPIVEAVRNWTGV